MLPGLTSYASDSSADEPADAPPSVPPDEPSDEWPTAATESTWKPPPMPLPPRHSRFLDPDTAIEHINKLAQPAGYAVNKLRSKKNKRGQVKKVVLRCDRGREYASSISETSHKHKTNTHTCGCRFQVTLRFQPIISPDLP
ncbi:hypothetical protein N7481_012230 [Penicillium waksmanii]|uniref:uncharacterized protein n=1 Tax=Penicillium waksmanii TaxID=69791 RepID=UPI002548EC47|nr:uncharacterized protein N7481_012230 [Penicillium waksmanii]KAJ5965516.1 hypothetical protein N7481_012230 [Penicillium waksmanii]